VSTWLQVAAWLSSIALITALINYLLEEKSKAAIRERASQIWFNFESRDALVVVKTTARTVVTNTGSDIWNEDFVLEGPLAHFAY
jgi:hypothetical protein